MFQRLMKICSVLLVVSVFSLRSLAQQGKAEIGIAYGYYSLFALKQGPPLSASTGTPNINMRYYLSNAVTIGLGVGFENINNWGSVLTFSPELTFCYLDTKDDRVRVRLYGAAAMGLTVFDDLNTNPGHADNSGPKLWGFQGTPFGIRIGRKFSVFGEVGVGYKGLINAGFSYRFRTTPRKSNPSDH